MGDTVYARVSLDFQVFVKNYGQNFFKFQKNFPKS